MHCDLLVIGAGAAGLMAAGTAAAEGRRVIVVEQMDQPGLKLLTTGGGRCNFTHRMPSEEMMERFGRHGRFMAPAFEALAPDALRSFFRRHGVESIVQEDGCVFPSSQSSRSILSALLDCCLPENVTFNFHTKVTALRMESGTLRGVLVRSHGATVDQPIDATAVLLTTGGHSYAELGGTGGGYALARDAGHSLTQTVPALVPLVTADAWPTTLAGIVRDDATIRIQHRRFTREVTRGPLLFTHRGISGPAVLDISGVVASLMATEGAATVLMNSTPNDDAATWRERFTDARGGVGIRRVIRIMQPFMQEAFAICLCRQAGVPADRIISQLQRTELDALVALLTEWPIPIQGTEGFSKAMVTRGGVSLKEVEPRTLQSRIVPGLFFAGEVLDLDGPCGGFNLQWAFSSGHLAALQSAPLSPSPV